MLAALLAAPVREGAYDRYIQKYSATAVSEMKRTGVPASITLAQGLVESAAGESALAVKGNNHFGIKCHADWRGKKIYRDDDKSSECFRVYPNADASFRDHSDFLRYRDRYKKLFDLEPTDYKAWAKGLKAAGYATDPRYAEKLIKVIEDYQLYRFDQDTEVPVTPSVVETPQEIRPSRVQEEYRFSMSRNVYEINGVPCIYALEGDSYPVLAAHYGLFPRELLAFNDLKEETALHAGDVVFLKRKKAKAAKGAEKYIIGDDTETLRAIAQRFGVRMASLRRMNKLSADYTPHEGDTIILRSR